MVRRAHVTMLCLPTRERSNELPQSHAMEAGSNRTGTTEQTKRKASARTKEQGTGQEPREGRAGSKLLGAHANKWAPSLPTLRHR